MTQIFFDTKENNNKRREEEFLQLTPDRRFWTFVKMVDELAIFQTKNITLDKGNFVIEKKKRKMEQLFDKNVRRFIQLSIEKGVRMLLVGGGAVNFHGYQRHSADVDFWIEVSETNLLKLREVLNAMGFELKEFPAEVKQSLQNVSIKISPVIELELITRFDPGKSFDDAFKQAVPTNIEGMPELKYFVLSYDDLINSKLKSGRPKDLLDIQELKRVNKK